MKPVVFNSTLLRDAHQSLAATRMSTAQMLPILDKLDAVGYGRLETWGGASIDAGLRFLKEFPFKRLDALRAKTKTPHMMLMRGQNIVAYNQSPDDVVAAFATQAIRHGMNTIRIFDALNDPRNMKTAIEATKKAGGEAQGTICYTNSPVHTVEGFIKLGCTLADMGVHSLCLKDMAGLVSPRAAYDIIKGLKDNVKVPVWFHTHETTGLGASSYLAAIDAGVDAVDVAIRPFSDGTAHPDHTRMISKKFPPTKKASTKSFPNSRATKTKSSTLTRSATKFPAGCFPTSATSSRNSKWKTSSRKSARKFPISAKSSAGFLSLRRRRRSSARRRR